MKALFGCLNHILPSTRLNAAWCLRTCILSIPNQMSLIIDQLIKRLNDFRSNRQAIEGHAAAISAIIATSNITSPRGLAPGKVTKILGLCSELLKPVNDTSASLSRVMGAWLLYAGLLSAKYLAKREKNDLRNAIMAQIKSCFPQKDVKGVFIKELTLGQDKLSTLIETRSGALRAIQILSEAGDDVIEDVIIKKTVTAVLRSAVEYLKHVNDVATKYPNLKSAIKFYKMRLYRTLTVSQTDVWEYALADLFKHIVADLTLVEAAQLAHTSLLPNLASTDVATLIDHKDIEINLLGALQHSASEMITSSEVSPTPYPLQESFHSFSLLLRR